METDETDEAKVDLSLNGIWSCDIRKFSEILFLRLRWVFYTSFDLKIVKMMTLDDTFMAVASRTAPYN